MGDLLSVMAKREKRARKKYIVVQDSQGNEEIYDYKEE